MGLAAAGCGSSGGGAAKAGSSAKVKVSLGGLVANLETLPIWVAQAKGFFAQHGLDVKLTYLNDSSIIPALVSGSVHFDYVNATALIQASLKGAPVEAVSAYSEYQTLELIVGKQFAQQKGITSATPLSTVMKDLESSKGGSNSPVQTGMVDLLERSYGGKAPSTVLFSDQNSMIAAFKNNTIDWFATGAPQPEELAAAGEGVIVASRKNAPAWGELTLNNVLVTSDSYAAQNPATVKAMVAAVDEGVAYIHTHPAAAVATFKKYFPTTPTSILADAVSLVQWPTKGTLSAKLWSDTIGFWIKAGTMQPGTKLTEGHGWTNKFVG